MTTGYTPPECTFFHFGLIVTGKGEAKHLPKLFTILMTTRSCYFEVITCVGQRFPITSEKKRLKMVGSGKIIPDRDAMEIGLPARGYVSNSPCHFAIVIDDLEHDRRDMIDQVYIRYRTALDAMLSAHDRKRASVHFLANMLEAYYFADMEALNQILPLEQPWPAFEGDVELIPHPKGEIKRLYPGFHEVDDGERILEVINISTVLSNPTTCAWLRTLFAWCVNIIEKQSYVLEYKLRTQFCITEGIMADLTRTQIDLL